MLIFLWEVDIVPGLAFKAGFILIFFLFDDVEVPLGADGVCMLVLSLVLNYVVFLSRNLFI